MTDSRAAILSKLDKSSSGKWKRPERIQPGFVTQSGELSEQLKQKLQAVHASVDIVLSAGRVEQSIADFLQRHQSPMEVGVTSGIDIDTLATDQGVVFYPCDDFAACHTVLTRSAYGIAETGTVVLPSSLQHPTLANFLPDNCIVLLNETDIVPYMEEALLKVRNSDEGMPRALNLISGPSKTADIEQTLVYGAHGPIQLHVIVIINER